MKKTTFAIVGCGHIAKRHAKHILDHENASLVGGYDTNSSRLEEFCRDLEITPYPTLEQLLQDETIDVINVCTPNGLHHSVAMEALRANKDLLIEKPMALKKEDCEEIISSALNQNRKVFVVKQNRYNPPIVALKKLVETKALGEIYFVSVNCFWNRNAQYYEKSDWKGSKALDGGTLFTQFSHFIDVVYYLFGDMTDFKGITKNVNHSDLIEFEDSGSFTFRFKNGALGNLNYTTSSFKQNMEGSITLFAEKGTIKVGGKYLSTIDYQVTEGCSIENLPDANPANNYGYYEGSMSNHDSVIDNVVKTLQGDGKIMTNAFEGMKVVEIIENMYRAADHLSPSQKENYATKALL